MRITLKKNAEQIELVKAMGSKDSSVSREALEAFATFIGPVIQQVLQTAGTASLIYADKEFDEDDSPSIPLDLYYDIDVGYVSTWSQNQAGGLPTNQIEGVREMKISTYRLDTAISFMKKYARKSRLDVVSKAVERMAQEMLLKQERNAWAVVLQALAQARTLTNKHVIKAGNESVFHVNDLSRLMTLLRRIHASWSQGTPVGASGKGITDLFVSPEIKEQIRGFAFNPMNVKDVAGAATTVASNNQTSIPLPDSIREQIFKGAGTTEFYGINITDLNELGLNRKYNVLFQEFGGSDSAFGFSGGTSSNFS